ncbi:hypothetical protein RRG08_036696 [Elysia crispata]|uniref:Uncharacterized protein n=1 Tax=Elysia crispata TaxID=231223 RepID=A0AAE0YVI2_9GAST|nr:hypothetical protein RRG08_036696 [Elysia crispata]
MLDLVSSREILDNLLLVIKQEALKTDNLGIYGTATGRELVLENEDKRTVIYSEDTGFFVDGESVLDLARRNDQRRNLALKHLTVQSSTFGPWISSRAVDGKLDIPDNETSPPETSQEGISWVVENVVLTTCFASTIGEINVMLVLTETDVPGLAAVIMLDHTTPVTILVEPVRQGIMEASVGVVAARTVQEIKREIDILEPAIAAILDEPRRDMQGSMWHFLGTEFQHLVDRLGDGEVG